MPKDTFYNLSTEKRNKITNVAIDEFAEHSYQGASISRIVHKAGIAKGSFYQYFEDKKDLFKYLYLDVLVEKKAKYMSKLSKTEQMDFFEILHEMYLGSIKFAKENPKIARIANDFTKNADNKLKEEVMGVSINKSNQILEALLVNGINKGEIDPEIDIELTAFIISSLSVSIGEYFIKDVKVDNDEEIMPMLNKLLQIFKKGIQKAKE